MANQPLAVGPLPAPRHKTFASLFADREADPCHGNYQRIMARFDPDANAPPFAVLLEQAVSTGSVPQAYLCCSHTAQRMKVYCLHTPSKFVGALDGAVTPWDNRAFAYLGELIQGTVTTINLPATAFRPVNNIRMKTSDYMVTHLNELTPMGFTPAAAQDADATLLNTRPLMYLPARYVPLLLDPSGYSIRQLWEILYPAIVDANELQICQPLINWMRAASTCTLVAAALAPSPVAIDLQVPIADEVLIKHRMTLLKQLLPAVGQPEPSFETALTQMAAAVVQNTNDNRSAHDAKLAREQTPKLPSEKYTVTLNVLQEFLTVEDERLLPQLWHQWANCSKRQEFQVLNDLLHSYTRSPEAFSSCVPIVTSKLVQDLQNFVFVGDSMDDLKSGLQPFIISEGSAEHRQANLEISRMYGLLQSGEQALMLSDLQALQAREAASIPLNYFELERNLGMFGTLLGTVLGNQHVITTAYRAFWVLLSQGFRNELQQIIDVKGYVKPAHILRSIQLACFSWFTQCRHRLAPPDPNFLAIINTVILNTYTLPRLPPNLYKLAYPKPTPLATPTPGPPSLTASLTSSDASSTISNLSTPTGLTNAGLPPGGNRQKGAWLANLHPDRDLQNIVNSDIKLKDLIADEQPPTLDNGAQVCLSYLIRRGCWSTCKRINTHGHNMMASEKARVKQYLENQVRKLSAPSSQTTPP